MTDQERLSQQFAKEIDIDSLDQQFPQKYKCQKDNNNKYYTDVIQNYKKHTFMMSGYELIKLDVVHNAITLDERRYYFNYLLSIFNELRGKQRFDFIYDYLQLFGRPNPKTESDMIEEYYLSKKYPKYFIQNYIVLKLANTDANFIMNYPQHQFVDACINNHYVRVLKSRQIGISTIQQALLAHSLTFYSGIQCGVISKDKGEAQNFQNIVKNMMRDLPPWMFSGFEIDNVYQSKTQATGSTLWTGAVKVDEPSKLFRGKPLTNLVLDEQGFIKKLEEQLSGIEPAVSRAQSVSNKKNIPYYTTEISTPNGTTGIGKLYYNHIQESMIPGSPYKLLQLHWSQVPEFADDPTWYENQKKKYASNPRLLNQEYELKFLGSTSSLFSDEVIEELQNSQKYINIIKAYNFDFIFRKYLDDTLMISEQKLEKHENYGFDDDEYIKLYTNQLHIFKEAEDSHLYVFGIDPATETGKDQSAFTVVDYFTKDVVQTFLGKLSMKNFKNVIRWTVENLYPNSKLFAENNGVGKGLMEEIVKDPILDPLLYYTVTYDKNNNNILSRKAGVNNNPTTRGLVMDAIFSEVNNNTQSVRSKLLQYQLISLYRDSIGKILGDSDDQVLSYGWAIYQINQNLLTKTQNYNVKYDTEEINEISQIISDKSDKDIEIMNMIDQDYKKELQKQNKKQKNNNNIIIIDDEVTKTKKLEEISRITTFEEIKKTDSPSQQQDEELDMAWINDMMKF